MARRVRLVIIQAMLDNEDYDVPSQDDLTRWADTYGLTIPLFTDVRSQMRSFVGASGASAPGMPYTALIDRGGMIIDVAEDTITIDDARALL